MALKLGNRDIARIVAVLEEDHETVQDAAEAIMAEAEALFAERAKFVVVGQLVKSAEDGLLDPTDPRAIKLSLGWYSTEGDARAAAESLWHNTGSGDTFATWWLPTHHGTPAELHKARREKYQEAASKAKDRNSERLRKSIEKRQAEAEKRAAEYLMMCKCGSDLSEHSSSGAKPCRRIGCPCEKYEKM